MTRMTADKYQRRYGRNPKLLRRTGVVAPPSTQASIGDIHRELATSVTFWVPGEFPTRNDHERVSRGNRFAAAALKKKHDRRVYVVAVQQPMVRGRFLITCKWVRKTRRADPDNVQAAIKYVLDGMVQAGMVQGDSMRYAEIGPQPVVVDRERPGVLVTVEAVR